MGRKKTGPLSWSRVSLTQDGREYSGMYSVSVGKYPVLEVSSDHGTKRTQLGGMPPETLARLLLSELIPRHS